MTQAETQLQTQTFELNPPELTFRLIDNIHLMELIVKHLEMSVAQISKTCEWYKDDKAFEICMNCSKDGKSITKFHEERDFIIYLVQQEVLPEGNYLVKIRT